MIFNPYNLYGTPPLSETHNSAISMPQQTPVTSPNVWGGWGNWFRPQGGWFQTPNRPMNQPINGNSGGVAQALGGGLTGMLGPQFGMQRPMTGSPPNFNFDLNDPRLRPMIDPFPMPSMPQPTSNRPANMNGLRGLLGQLPPVNRLR